MGQDDDQQPLQAGAMPAWFNPVNPASPPPKPKKSPLRIVIIGGVILLICLVATLVFFVTRQPSTCLSVSDYKALTGVDTSDGFSPTETFYDNYVLFDGGALTYDNSTDGGLHGDALIHKIADFYKSHTTKPMLITISASYLTPENEELTNQRIATVRSSLLSAGVPESVVVVSGASYITPEDAIEGNGDTGEIAIAITSDSMCR